MAKPIQHCKVKIKQNLKKQKAEEPDRDQIINICWIIEKAREFQKNIYSIDYSKAFDCVDHNKLWKILQVMGILDHFTKLPLVKPVCRSRSNSYSGTWSNRLVPN